jgi:ureidoglycolate lyase
MREMMPEPLTAEAFAPFGQVIEATDRAERLDINFGNTIRFHDLADIDVGDDQGRPIVSIFRGQPLIPPLLRIFERHPVGSQAFIPLDGRPFLVAVAPPGAFDAGKVRLFRAAGTQGVNYAKGVWHHFLLPLEADSDFLVIDRDGPGDNLDEIELDDDSAVLVQI